MSKCIYQEILFSAALSDIIFIVTTNKVIKKAILALLVKCLYSQIKKYEKPIKNNANMIKNCFPVKISPKNIKLKVADMANAIGPQATDADVLSLFNICVFLIIS